jgi:hypothetical protein
LFEQNGVRPPGVFDWVRTNLGEATARVYQAKVSGDQGLLDRPTTASKYGPASYRPSDKYSAQDWWYVDSVIQKNRSLDKATAQIIEDPNTTQQEFEALAAQHNLTPEQLATWYEKKKKGNGGKDSAGKNTVAKR